MRVVRLLADQLKGRLSVRSPPAGGGTCVAVSFPAACVARSPSEAWDLATARRRGDDVTAGIDPVALRVVTVAELVTRDRLVRVGLRSLRVVRALASDAPAAAVDAIAFGIDLIVVLV